MRRSDRRWGGGGRRRVGREGSGATLLLVAAAVLLGSTDSFAEPIVSAQLDRRQAAVGEQVALTVRLEGFSGRTSDPEVPVPEGMELYDAGRSTNIQWINGKLSSAAVFTYVLVPRRAGKVSLGPVRVEHRGTLYRSEALELEVAEAVAGAPNGSAPRRRETVAASEEGIFARALVDRDTAYPGQQVTLRFRLYQRQDVDLREIGQFEPPATPGFWREDLGAQRDYVAEIDATSYRVRELAWALFPTETGALEIGPARIVCQVPEHRRRGRGPFSSFFGSGLLGRRAVPLETDPIAVTVMPLPTAGRPPGFTGSVGDYDLSVSVDTARVHQGEPFTLTATIAGAGNLQAVGEPRWPDWEGLRVYDSGEGLSLHRAGDRLRGERSFTQVLIPQRAGRLEIGPLTFAYFDPEAERYVTRHSAPLAIEVGAGEVTGDGPGAEGWGVRGEDILYIRTDVGEELARREASRGRVGWLIHALPLAFLGVAGWLRRRRQDLARDPVRARRGRALGVARAACTRLPDESQPAARGVAALLEEYLTAWLALPVRGVRRGELRGTLADQGLAEPLIEEVVTLLDWSEEVRFGAGGQERTPDALRGEARALLERLEQAFRGAAPGGGR